MSKIIFIFFLGSYFVDARELPEKVYKWIEKAECGHITPPCCHKVSTDAGGFTCIGVSFKHNKKTYFKAIGQAYNPRASFKWVSDSRGNLVENSIRQDFKEIYYEKYYKRFEKCPPKIALQLADSYILSGQGPRLFQRAMRLTQDNIFGKESIKACNSNPDMVKFKEERIKRFKRLRGGQGWKANGKGWIKRLDNLDKYIKNNYK